VLYASAHSTSTSVVPRDGFWLKLKHVTQYATRHCKSVFVLKEI